MINLDGYSPVEDTKAADQFGQFENFRSETGEIKTLYTPWKNPYDLVNLDHSQAQWI